MLFWHLRELWAVHNIGNGSDRASKCAAEQISPVRTADSTLSRLVQAEEFLVPGGGDWPRLEHARQTTYATQSLVTNGTATASPRRRLLPPSRQLQQTVEPPQRAKGGEGSGARRLTYPTDRIHCNGSLSFCTSGLSPFFSDVQIAHKFRILLDEQSARLHFVAHQRRERVIGENRIFHRHLQNRARLGVHRR
jgi:hypothetical protein